TDQEPAHTPRFRGQRMHDLVSELLRFFVRGVDIIGVNRDHGVGGGPRIARDELDVRAAVWGGVPGYPAHVDPLGAQHEIVGVEALRGIDIGDPKVGRDAFSVHVDHLSSACRARKSTTASANRSLRSPATICPAPPTSTKSTSGNRAMNSSARSLVTRSLTCPRTRSIGTPLWRIASTAAYMRSTSVTSIGGCADVPSMNFGSQCQYQRPSRWRRLVRRPSRSVGRGRCGLYSWIASATSSSDSNPDVMRSFMKSCIREAP